MLEQMITYIKENNLFEEKDHLLLAVSGGVDSVVMAELFSKSGFNFAIAHCNFKLRGADSDADEQFVKELSRRFKVKYFTTSFSTEKFAVENKLSLQMAARELRYKWFNEIVQQNNFNFVCTAHHLNDSIETVLINLTKGTGISGLTGIKAKNGNIVRPLLFAKKEDIEAYARANKISFRTDVSNISDDYLRNKIRLKIIPVLKEINPALEETFQNNILHLKDIEYMSDEYFQLIKIHIVSEDKKALKIDIQALRKQKAPGTILYYILREYNFSPVVSSQVFKAMDAQSGKKFYSPTHQLLKHGNYFFVSVINEDENNKTAELAENSMVIFGDKIITAQTITLDNEKNIKYLNSVIKKSSFAALDYDKLSFPLKIRSSGKGDFFYPYGMKGKRKKLSDYFVDKKIPLHEKSEINVVISGNEIIWVAGYRTDERFAVTPGTKKVLLLQLKYDDEN